MAHWKHKVNIKKYLGDDTSKAGMQACYEGITKELKPLVNVPSPAGFERYAKLAIQEDDIEIFNGLAMNALYDWADRHRVWLGVL